MAVDAGWEFVAAVKARRPVCIHHMRENSLVAALTPNHSHLPGMRESPSLWMAVGAANTDVCLPLILKLLLGWCRPFAVGNALGQAWGGMALEARLIRHERGTEERAQPQAGYADGMYAPVSRRQGSPGTCARRCQWKPHQGSWSPTAWD